MAAVAGIALVEAPTALAGFRLVMLFPGTHSHNTRDALGHWVVQVPVSDAAEVQLLMERVQAWMRRHQIAETSVRLGEDVYSVGVDHADLQTG